jgi:Acyl-CoA carboxylase epsilon subunit
MTSTVTTTDTRERRVNTPDDDAAGAAVESEATLRVVRGEPTPEELAALVAVIATRVSGSGGEAAARPTASAWTDRSRYVRPRLWHTSDGWRASDFPQ